MTTPPAVDVLVIDDQDDMRMLVRKILEDAGYTVLEVATGAEALVYLQTHPHPRLILLDLMMPVMTGWEFRQWQRTIPALATIPVVVLSAVAPFSPQLDALDAVAIVPKPFRAEQLLATVHGSVSAPA